MDPEMPYVTKVKNENMATFNSILSNMFVLLMNSAVS
jgi:hypothetical protein